MSRAAAKATPPSAKAAAAVPPAHSDVTPEQAGANALWSALSLRTPDGGRPLDAENRAFFGRAFGRDFGDVRLHDGPRADALAGRFGANAITSGRDIHFARGRLAPHTTAGRSLLAHELTHVVQQEGVSDAPPSAQAFPALTRPGDPAERAAEAAARAVAAGRAVPGGVLDAAPATRPTIARDVGTGQAGAILDDSRFWQDAGRTAEGFVYSKLEYEPQPKGELGETLAQKKLIHDRDVVVETADGIRAHLVVHGVFTLPTSTPDAPPLQMLDAVGRGYVSGTVYVTVKRGAMRDWFGFDFFEGPGGNGTSMRATAASGGRYLHFGLDHQEQVDALMDEVRRRLPRRAKQHDTISDEDFKRLTRDEKAQLARDAIGDAIELSHVVKTVLIGLALGLLALLAILAAVFAPAELAIGLLAAFVVASIVALVYLVKDAIADFVDRITDNDIVGGILSALKAVAEAVAVVLGAIAVGLAVFAAIVGAPFEAAGLVVAAIVLAVVAVGIALYLAYRDYQSAADAKDLDSFRKHTQRSARAIEGAIAAVVTAAITAGIAKVKGLAGGSRTGGGGATPTKPTPPPPKEPAIIEPPQVAPAAPPVPEVPQVAPPGPVIPEVPQVAGPTIMKPNVTSPAGTVGGDVVVDLPPGVKIVKPPKGPKAPKPPKPPTTVKPPATPEAAEPPPTPEPPATKPPATPQPPSTVEPPVKTEPPPAPEPPKPVEPAPAKKPPKAPKAPKVDPEDRQAGVKAALERSKERLEEHLGDLEARKEAVDLAAKKLRDAKAASDADPKNRQLLRDLKKAREDAAEAEAQRQHLREQINEETARRDRLKAALDAKTYERPKFREGLRDKVWDLAPKEPDGSVLSPSGAKIKPGDPWVMGHKEKYEFWKHQRSAAERGITREQFIEEYNREHMYRPETEADNSSHFYENKTDDYLGP